MQLLNIYYCSYCLFVSGSVHAIQGTMFSHLWSQEYQRNLYLALTVNIHVTISEVQF